MMAENSSVDQNQPEESLEDSKEDSKGNNNNQNPPIETALLVTLITVAGTIIVAIITASSQYIGPSLIINATAAAEARATQTAEYRSMTVGFINTPTLAPQPPVTESSLPLYTSAPLPTPTPPRPTATTTWTATVTEEPTPTHTATDTLTPTATLTLTPTTTPTQEEPTVTSTFTSIPPTVTPTFTPIPPTSTSTQLPPTSTPIPVPPTATFTQTTTPTLLIVPTSTTTPIPLPPTDTFTPTNTPLPQPAVSYPQIQLLDAHEDNKQAVLSWLPVGLAPSDHYVVVVEHGTGENWLVTDNTSWTTDAWLYDDKYRKKGGFQWYVAICSGGPLGGSGENPGCMLSAKSRSLPFTWSTPGTPGTPGICTPNDPRCQN